MLCLEPGIIVSDYNSDWTYTVAKRITVGRTEPIMFEKGDQSSWH